MSHEFYVFASWGISFIVIAGMTGYIIMDGKRRQEDLRRLDEAGVRRRSARDPAVEESR